MLRLNNTGTGTRPADATGITSGCKSKELGRTTIPDYVFDFSNAVRGLGYFCADACAAQQLFDPDATIRLTDACVAL